MFLNRRRLWGEVVLLVLLYLHLPLIRHVLILGVLGVLMILMFDLVFNLVVHLMLDLVVLNLVVFDLMFHMGIDLWFRYTFSGASIIERTDFHRFGAWGWICNTGILCLLLGCTHIGGCGGLRNQSTGTRACINGYRL